LVTVAKGITSFSKVAADIMFITISVEFHAIRFFCHFVLLFATVVFCGFQEKMWFKFCCEKSVARD